MCMRTILTVPPPELEDRGSLLRLSCGISAVGGSPSPPGAWEASRAPSEGRIPLACIGLSPAATGDLLVMKGRLLCLLSTRAERVVANLHRCECRGEVERAVLEAPVLPKDGVTFRLSPDL